MANFFIFLNLGLLNSEIKRLLSDGFNTAAIGNFLTKSHRLSDVVTHRGVAILNFKRRQIMGSCDCRRQEAHPD